MIQIRTIDHNQQRYETVGDWEWLPDGTLQISISKMDDWRYEFLVGLHELVEVMVCKYAGVTQQQVDDFDFAYEKNRKEGDESEPGDDPNAPYHTEHVLAEIVERTVAFVMGINWNDYMIKVESLSKEIKTSEP